MRPFRSCQLLLTCLLLSSLWANPLLAAPVTYKIDPAHSTLQFSVAHLDVSRVIGRFDRLDGAFVYDAAKVDACSAQLTISADSVDTANAERDQHLRSSDFFDAGQFPQIGFQSTAVSGTASAFTLAGELTMHGVRRPISFQVKKIGEGHDPWGGYRIGFEATATLKRSDFGMAYMLGAVGDEATLTVVIEGLKQ